jgi:2,3-bisphosphoglycerate-dependent phosphoglycerate mutase
MTTRTLVLLRHGQSQWNLDNRFTGWVDVDITAEGAQQARSAGALMKAEHLQFDVAHTSVLKRAIRTLNVALDEMDQAWIPVHKSWRLNERHYGSLQGLDKAQMTAQHGEAQVKIWRRSYDVPPPPMKKSDPGHPKRDRRYRDVPAKLLPSTESLKTTLERVLPYWRKSIAPQLKEGQVVLIAAHGNSLRALYKYLTGISEQEIVEMNIPTGIPLLFKLDAKLRPRSHRYLGDPAAAQRAAAAVAAQATTAGR